MQTFFLIMLAHDFLLGAGFIVAGILFIISYSSTNFDGSTIRSDAKLTGYIIIGFGGIVNKEKKNLYIDLLIIF